MVIKAWHEYLQTHSFSLLWLDPVSTVEAAQHNIRAIQSTLTTSATYNLP